MKLSQLFTRTKKENPKDETSINAKFLERGGFIYKNSSGIYTFLPLGLRVIKKIEDIIREEMNAIGGQELFMQTMVEKKYFDSTGRWNVDIGFKVGTDKNNTDSFVLGWTHEEVITEIVSKFIDSYKDLPFSAYQIQSKFRNEPRAKSGLLRGKEFMMKDLYSFHVSEDDMLRFYGEVKEAYHRIFHRCGLETFYTIAGGGDFTSGHTHEFQVISPVGEDTIFLCSPSAGGCGHAENSEVSKLKDGEKCPACGLKVKEEKAIEVGNIFPLGTKYSEAFGLYFVDERGDKKPITMGSYGIGLSRVMGTIVEIHHDDKGIIWPESVAPFKFYLIALDGAKKEADEVYEKLVHNGAEVLYDDRHDKTAGEKFADADLLGIPVRLVISQKTLKESAVEVKNRSEKETKIVALTKILDLI